MEHESGESSTADTPELKPVEPAQRFDHYEVVKGEDGKPVDLGRGAMGVTFKAFDINLLGPVTLKVVTERYLGDESARLRFLREAAPRRAFVTRTLCPSSTWAPPVKTTSTRWSSFREKRFKSSSNAQADWR